MLLSAVTVSPGITRARTTAMPVTPPVEKWLGNLKKYTPAALRTIARVMVPKSRRASLPGCIRGRALSIRILPKSGSSGRPPRRGIARR